MEHQRDSVLRHWMRPAAAWVSGPDPIGEVLLPWRSGVTALYGRNGAGKTRLLNAVSALVRCEPTPVGAEAALLMDVVELPRIEEPIEMRFPVVLPGIDLIGIIREEIRSKGFRVEPGQPWSGADSLGSALGDLLFGQFTADHERHPDLWSETRWSRTFLTAIVDELVRLGSLFVEPLGDGAWSIAWGLGWDAEARHLNDERHRVQGAWQSFRSTVALAGVFDLDSRDAAALVDDEVFACEFGDDPRFRYGDSPITTLTSLGSALSEERIGDADRAIRRITTSPYPVPLFHDLVRLPPGDLVSRFTRALPRVLGDTLEDLDQRTEEVLQQRRSTAELRLMVGIADTGEEEPPSARFIDPGDPPTVSTWLREQIADLNRLANEFAETFLIDAPILECQLASPQEWFGGPALRWRAWDRSGKAVDIDHLSEAQRRWARNAVDLALQSGSSSGPLPVTNVLCLDEPDAALHASAERHLVDGLVTISEQLQLSVLVSTHSREFLNHPDVDLVHITRDDEGRTTGRRLDDRREDLRTRSDELGLDPSDLLQRYRVLLIVEGHHDKLLLEAIIGTELERARTLVLAMRGARHAASVVDAQIIEQFSDAVVIAALDNLQADEIRDVWASALGAATVPEGQAVLEAAFSGKKSSEQGFLKEYCIAALRSGAPERFHVFGFSAPDIIEYLPVDAMIPEGGSWDSLRKRAGGKSLKPWMTKNYGVTFSDEVLLGAVARMDEVPEDFVALADLCARLARQAHRFGLMPPASPEISS